MKLLSEDLLKEFGFVIDDTKSNHILKIYCRDKLGIVLKDNSFYYTNLGIDYPLRDLAALRRLYKEIKNTELIVMSRSIISK
jgi:hypothetical protein